MMFQPWEWKKKIGLAALIFLILGIILLLAAWNMRTVDENGSMQDNWVAGAMAGLGVGILFGGCLEGLLWDVKKSTTEASNGGIIGLFLGGIIGSFVGGIVGGIVGVATGGIIGLFVGLFVGGGVGEWAAKTKVNGFHAIEGREREIQASSRKIFLLIERIREYKSIIGPYSSFSDFSGDVSELNSLQEELTQIKEKLDSMTFETYEPSIKDEIADISARIDQIKRSMDEKVRLAKKLKNYESRIMRDKSKIEPILESISGTISYGSRYGLDYSEETAEMEKIRKEVDSIKTGSFRTLDEKKMALEETERKVEILKSEANELKKKVEAKLKSGEKMYQWLLNSKAIRYGQSISHQVLLTVYEIYMRWEKLKNDKSIDDRIFGVKEEISELERIRTQYEDMASHGTTAGKAAKKELEKIEQQLSMKNSELEQLKKLKDEQKRSITELEDQAKLYVLTALAGRVGITSQEVIDHAEKMIKTLKKGLEDIEIPRGEFMGYPVLRKIHHGGFADIYLLKKDGKYYALKVPKDVDIFGENETLLISEEEIEAFEKEGKIWKEISSIDGVVNLIDYGLRPFPWFIMEYMDGGTLKDHIGNTDEKKAVEYIESVLKVLSAIHDRGIIHRDIKPENILFDSEGDIKLTDFGLSRVLSSSSSTGAGFKGTLVYSAPEQFDRKTFGSPDSRTDIYQTGAVLYELLTGRPPFTGSTQEIINGIMTKIPERPSSINPNIDEGMDSVVLKALEKRKEDRWQGAMEFKKALEVDTHL